MCLARDLAGVSELELVAGGIAGYNIGKHGRANQIDLIRSFVSIWQSKLVVWQITGRGK